MHLCMMPIHFYQNSFACFNLVTIITTSNFPVCLLRVGISLPCCNVTSHFFLCCPVCFQFIVPRVIYTPISVFWALSLPVYSPSITGLPTSHTLYLNPLLCSISHLSLFQKYHCFSLQIRADIHSSYSWCSSDWRSQLL